MRTGCVIGKVKIKATGQELRLHAPMDNSLFENAVKHALNYESADKEPVAVGIFIITKENTWRVLEVADGVNPYVMSLVGSEAFRSYYV